MQHHLQLSGHNKTELIFIDPSILEKYRVKKEPSIEPIVTNSIKRKKRKRFNPIAYLEDDDDSKKKKAKGTEQIVRSQSTTVKSKQSATAAETMTTTTTVTKTPSPASISNTSSNSKRSKEKTVFDELNFNKKKLKVKPLSELITKLKRTEESSYSHSESKTTKKESQPPEPLLSIKNNQQFEERLERNKTQKLPPPSSSSSQQQQQQQQQQQSHIKPLEHKQKTNCEKILPHHKQQEKEFERDDEFIRLKKEEQELRRKLQEIRKKKREALKLQSASRKASICDTDTNTETTASDENEDEEEEDEFEVIDEKELDNMSPEELEQYYNRNYSAIIRKLSRYKPKYEFNDDFDFDDRDMEATFDEITQEEMRSARLGLLEDRLEEKRQRKSITKKTPQIKSQTQSTQNGQALKHTITKTAKNPPQKIATTTPVVEKKTLIEQKFQLSSPKLKQLDKQTTTNHSNSSTKTPLPPPPLKQKDDPFF